MFSMSSCPVAVASLNNLNLFSSFNTGSMQALAEKILIGRWRSFKAFGAKGEIKLYTGNTFRELYIDPDKQLTIKTYQAQQVKQEVKTEAWKVVSEGKRLQLQIPDYNLSYEVITVNHTILVLQESASKDKIFFARNEHWNNFLESNRQIVL